MKISTYHDLAATVDQSGGVLSLEMGVLRDVHGAGKLGSIVVAAIHDKLGGLGLGHAPMDELPRDQWRRVLVYRKGTPVARLIEAALSIDEHSDATLREFASKDNKAEGIVQRIKELARIMRHRRRIGWNPGVAWCSLFVTIPVHKMPGDVKHAIFQSIV